MKKNNKVNPLKYFNDNKAMAYKKAGGAMKDFQKSLKRYPEGGEGGPKPTSTPSSSPSPSPQSQQTPKEPISDNDLMMAMLEKGISPRDMKKVMKAKTKVAVNPNTVIDAAGKVVSSGINAVANRGNMGGGDGPDGPFKKGGSTKKMQKGGSLKPVPPGKVGLSKLPTPVRNKMGYQKKGGSIKRK
jgi:hypothetical protein